MWKLIGFNAWGISKLSSKEGLWQAQAPALPVSKALAPASPGGKASSIRRKTRRPSCPQGRHVPPCTYRMFVCWELMAPFGMKQNGSHGWSSPSKDQQNGDPGLSWWPLGAVSAAVGQMQWASESNLGQRSDCWINHTGQLKRGVQMAQAG